MRRSLLPTTALFLGLFLAGCEELPNGPEATELADTEDLATCTVTRTEAPPELGGAPPPISVEGSPRASACAELNDHLASIAHIRALFEDEMLDEGGVE